MALEPDRWLLQVHPAGYIRFGHGLVEGMGTYLLINGNDLTSLSNVDFSKCFVEVDVVEMMWMSGMEQRHTLAVMPFQPQKYDQTCDAFGFSSLGGPHATPEPAPSALNNGCL